MNQSKKYRIRLTGFAQLVLIGLIISSCSNLRKTKGLPDTSPIAFANTLEDGPLNIFLASEDGEIRKQLTFGKDRDYFPSWSPDGKSIAFTSDRGSAKSCYGMRLDDYSMVELPEEGSTVSEKEEEGIIPMERGEAQVWIMNADGSDQRQLTFEGRNAHPSWSPDGKTIAFSSTRTGLLEIFLMNPDGRNQRQLTFSDYEEPGIFEKLRKLELHFHGLYSPDVGTPIQMFPSWSPDGSKIAFCSIRHDSYAIWSIDVQSGELSRLTYPHGDRYIQANTPSWSPEGDKIAFWSGVNFGPGSIWLMNPDGSNRIRISDEPESATSDEASWKPDGSKILYSTVRQDSRNGMKSGIWMVNPDGSDNRPFIKNSVAGANRASWRKNKH